MKQRQLSIRLLILTILLLGMAQAAFSKEQKTKSAILQRIYEYQQLHNPLIDSVSDNVYAKFRFNVEKRNVSMWFIPSLYVMAKGPREYIRESYSKVDFKDAHHYDINSQVVAGTIHHNRRAMPTLLDYLTPNIYDIALYDGHMLSPFNRHNRRYYRFTEKNNTDGTTRLEFRPKLYNTQLVNGYAIIETETGRIIRTTLNGEYDMIRFRTEIQPGKEGARSLMPERCTTVGTFKFFGNRISTYFDANYNCDLTLPDTIHIEHSRSKMDSIRPIPLDQKDKDIYKAYDESEKEDSIRDEEEKKHPNMLKRIFWDTIGDNLVTPISSESDVAYFSLSPIINPLYLSYSHSRGFRYKMKLRTRLTFSPHRYLTLNPTLGYNFKLREFYYSIPLRMTYNPKRNGYAEIIYGNDNRITNTSVMDRIHEIYGDSVNLDDKDLDLFSDRYLRVFNNIMLFDWLDIETGFVFHKRTALNQEVMKAFDMPTKYRSFAPMLGLNISPWLDKGPTFSIDYERGIKGVWGSDLEYERWEIDAQWKKRIPGLRLLNLRAGTGFFSHKQNNVFLDFAHFRDENLPHGWDDYWSGDFQLLRSRIYNQSRYYIRGNVSYESPLILATWVPYLGKFIEKERFYVSAVALERSKPYYELGYAFTNRYMSVGFFAGFNNVKYDGFSIEFEFELFRRW